MVTLNPNPNPNLHILQREQSEVHIMLIKQSQLHLQRLLDSESHPRCMNNNKSIYYSRALTDFVHTVQQQCIVIL